MRRDGAAVVFALTFPAVMAWLYFVLPAPGPADPSSPGLRRPNLGLQAGYAAGKVIQFSFPVLYLLLKDRRLPLPSRPTSRGLLLGLASGLAVAAATVALYHAFLRPHLIRLGVPERVRMKVAEFGLDTPAGFLLLAGFLSLAHSLLEEYYWRWFVFGRLRRLIPVGAAVLVSSLAFMAHHVIVLAVYLPGWKGFFTAALPLSACVGVGGAFWAWLYHRTESVYAPWLSHLLIDAAIMAVGYEMVFG